MGPSSPSKSKRRSTPRQRASTPTESHIGLIMLSSCPGKISVWKRGRSPCRCMRYSVYRCITAVIIELCVQQKKQGYLHSLRRGRKAEKRTQKERTGNEPVRLHYLFRKHFVQLNKASVKHVDLSHIFTPIVLPEFQCAAIQCEHLDRFIVRVCNPVFPNPSPLVQI